MGCRIVVGNLGSHDGVQAAVLYCSNTMVAFGPVMGSQEEAEKFCEWIPGDPRNYSHQDLMEKYNEFVRLYVCECGAVRDDDCPNHEYPKDAKGKHVAEDGEKYNCYFEDAPAAGERFECKRCAEKNAKRKARRAMPDLIGNFFNTRLDK